MANNPATEDRKLHSFDHSSKSRRRKRTVLNKEQINILVNYFAKQPYPGIEEREHLSRLINIPESRIQIWFQNRRARHPIQPKKLASEDSTNSRKWMCLEKVPLSPILEEDISKQNLMTPNASGCTGCLSWASEPGQEAGPNCSCFFERSSAAPTTENPCMRGYGISPNPHFVLSQTMRPRIDFQPGDLPRAVSQGSSTQLPFSWALQETKGSENYGSYTSFCGESKSPMHYQQQICTRDQFYPCYRPVPFQYTQETSHQPQNHPLLQQLTPSQHQSPQEFQDQTQVSPLVRVKEQQYELLPFCKQQELTIDLSKKTVECGSTLFLHDGHMASPMGDVAAPQGHQTDHQGDVAVNVGNLAAFLGDVAAPQRHITYHKDDVETLLRDLNALLGDLTAPSGRSNYPTERCG